MKKYHLDQDTPTDPDTTPLYREDSETFIWFIYDAKYLNPLLLSQIRFAALSQNYLD